MIRRHVLTGIPGSGLVTAASRWCRAAGAGVTLGHDDLYRVEVCVEELTTNLAKYGGAGCSGLPVELVLEVDERAVRLEVTDRCAPFDPLVPVHAPVPERLADPRPGGRGLQLVRGLADTAVYEHRDGCNRVTLTFELTRPAGLPAAPEELGRVAVLRDVPAGDRDAALGPLTVHELAADLPLLERGRRNRSVLFVLEGVVRVHLDRADGEDFVELGVGECVGEMSVIDDLPVSAHVVATEGTRLLVVDSGTFLDRVLTLPGVARHLVSAQAARTRRNDRVLVERTRRLMAMEQARREMDLARDIQASLLPQEPLLPDEDRVDCAGLMRPAREVGGDFYDVLPLGARHLLFVVADVCGKGLPAALFMVRAIAALRAAPRPSSLSEGHLEQVVGDLNRELCERNATRQYLTAFFGLLDLGTRHLRFVDAGHPPPLLAPAGGAFAPVDVPVNPPVGMVPGLRYRSGALRLGPGSRLLVVTDGVTEAEDGAGRMLGDEGLLAIGGSLPEGGATALVEAVVAATDTFADGAPQSDDITVLCVRST